MTVTIETEEEFLAELVIECLNDQYDWVEQIIGEFDRIGDSQKDQRLRSEKPFGTVRHEDDDAENIADQARDANDGNQIQPTNDLNCFENVFVFGVVHEVRLVGVDVHRAI